MKKQDNKTYNLNNIEAPVRNYGNMQIAIGDINNGAMGTHKMTATYTPEPLWRSPITMAGVTWVSLFIGILGIFPLSQVIKEVLQITKGDGHGVFDSSFLTYGVITCLCILLLVMLIELRIFLKSETRRPIMSNLAVNAYGKRIVLEKIRPGKCPQCGGKMKYYNKPIEWDELTYTDGKRERIIRKRQPTLECRRNYEHCYPVDPAEDTI